MGVFKIGETDREGRQKRIEHTGRYLRASRTGGVALRAHARVLGVNVTGNTSRGVRVSTRLAKNTQVATQNGRLLLRGRYGTDAATLNLSKSGLTVSSKTPVGAVNWVKPGRSSFKMAGIHVRGHKAAYLQGVYALVAVLGAAMRAALEVLAAIAGLFYRGAQRAKIRRELAERENARLELEAVDARAEGEAIARERGVDLTREPARDLFAALVFVVVCLGRGEDPLGPEAMGTSEPDDAAGCALVTEVRACGEQIRAWLGHAGADAAPEQLLGLARALTGALAPKLEEPLRGETLLSLDDACLASGPKTVIQEVMIDEVARALEVDLEVEGEV